MSSMLRRLGGFFGAQVGSFLIPFLALPVVAQHCDPNSWASLGLGQSIGGIASVIILFGWWTAGPTEYRDAPTEKGKLSTLRRSVYERVALMVVVLPASAAIGLVLQPRDIVLYVSGVFASASYGLSPSWFMVATSSPAGLLMYEVLPRSMFTALSLSLILASGGWVVSYPILVAVGGLVACVLSLRRFAPRKLCAPFALGDLLRELRRHVPLAGANLLGASYAQAPVPLGAAIAPAASLPGLVSGDRLYRPALFIITALGNTLQPWTFERPSKSRHMRAVVAHVCLGLAGGFICAVTLPVVTRKLFGSTLSSSSGVAVGYGLAFCGISVATPLIRNILIPAGHRVLPLIATALSALFGLAFMISFGHHFASAAIAAGLGISELLNAAVCALAASNVLKSIP